MLSKRIIPCLDVSRGRIVKGINFKNLKDAGDPVEMAKGYEKNGADELVILNITPSVEDKDVFQEAVKRIAGQIAIPLIVGGGIKSIEDIGGALAKGAHKISLNTAAVENPELITMGAKEFGSPCIIVAVDVRRRPSGNWGVYIKGGRTDTGKDVLSWAAEVEALGAGEILLTSMDRDGTKDGYDLELLRSVTKRVNIPVIASGGAGKKEHFFEAFTRGGADAALAASLFHYEGLTVMELKEYLSKKGVRVNK